MKPSESESFVQKEDSDSFTHNKVEIHQGETSMFEIFHRYKDCGPNRIITIHNSGTKKNVKLPPLKSLITAKQRREIIKKLFEGNEAEFESLINELESVTEWRAALERTEKALNKREIYLHDPEAILLTDILYSRYFPENEPINSLE